ncbi:MAG: ribulose-phosphate 3-epimerase [Clostridia bacterium]|nr:ribulose-phosphate 3-epimerase [Clostridia bacterium]
MIKLSPSLLAADPLHLGDALKLTLDAGCEELHFDVMDAHFVPNLTFGPHILAGMKKQADFCYDVHLMLTDPITMIDTYAKAGAQVITVHVEANGFEESLCRIRELGLKAGASINPATPAEALRPYLHLIDRVLLMTVVPGFGGQKFMPEALLKAKELREMGFTGEIEADGGVSPANMRETVDAGVDILVMGTAFFKAEDPYEVARQVHAL